MTDTDPELSPDRDTPPDLAHLSATAQQVMEALLDADLHLSQSEIAQRLEAVGYVPPVLDNLAYAMRQLVGLQLVTVERIREVRMYRAAVNRAEYTGRRLAAILMAHPAPNYILGKLMGLLPVEQLECLAEHAPGFLADRRQAAAARQRRAALGLPQELA